MKCDVICIGTAILDSIILGFNPEPVTASGFVAESCTLNAGGEGINESSALVSLGVKTQLLCFLGDDYAGRIMADILEKRGVDTGRIVWEKDRPTPVTTLFGNPDGSRKTIVNQAHRYNFHPEKYLKDLNQARALMLGSLFRAPFDDVSVIRSVLTRAKEEGLLVFADTKLPNYHFLNLDDLAELLPMVDYITPNEDEARYYSGRKEPEEMADVFLARGVKNVIIKLGNRGCLYKNSREMIRLPAYSVPVIDTVGAGDNFLAGFASELLRGSDPDRALRFASACGAVSTMAGGAGTALKSREQVLAFMRDYEKDKEQGLAWIGGYASL